MPTLRPKYGVNDVPRTVIATGLIPKGSLVRVAKVHAADESYDVEALTANGHATGEFLNVGEVILDWLR